MKHVATIICARAAIACSLMCPAVGCSSTTAASSTSPLSNSLRSVADSFKTPHAKTSSWTQNLPKLPPLPKLFGRPAKPHYAAKKSSPSQQTAKLTNREKERRDLQVGLARSLETQGKLDRAAQVYQQAIDSGLHDEEVYHRLAVIYDKTNRFDEADKLYREAEKLNSKDVELLSDHGYCLYLQKRYAEAERVLHRALDIDKSHRRARNNLAMVLARTERYDEAFSQFREAGADITEAHVNLAYVMMWNGKYQPAAEEFDAALAIDEACGPAKQGLDMLYAAAEENGVSLNTAGRWNHLAENGNAPQKPVSDAPQSSRRITLAPETEASAAKQPGGRAVIYTSEWPRKARY